MWYKNIFQFPAKPFKGSEVYMNDVMTPHSEPLLAWLWGRWQEHLERVNLENSSRKHGKSQLLHLYATVYKSVSVCCGQEQEVKHHGKSMYNPFCMCNSLGKIYWMTKTEIITWSVQHLNAISINLFILSYLFITWTAFWECHIFESG